ncbi:hypothetical protein K8I61_08460, partial [bacterium]|nr:hypothetical protein [bacterium]
IPDRPAPSWSYPANGDHPDWNENLDGPTIVFLDVNGDGYDDLLLGYGHLNFESGKSEQDSSTILVFFGSADGLSAEPDQYLFRDDSSIFAQDIQNAGDVNGDGFDDLLVHDWAGWIGRFFLFYGAPVGFNTDAVEVLPGDFQTRYDYSDPVAANIDINGDGFSDIVIVRHIANGTPEHSDDVYIVDVITGKESFSILDAPSWDRTYEGGTKARGIVALGDINGDGCDDFSICAYDSNIDRVYLDFFYGSETKPGDQPDDTVTGYSTDFPTWCSIGRAGDIDADGYDDLWGFDYYTGNFYAIYGSGIGILPVRTQLISPPTQDASLYSAKYLRDINNDGYDDLAISTAGEVIRVMFGTASGLDTASYWEYDWNDFTYSYIPYIGYDLGGEGGDVQNNGSADFAWTAQNYVGPGSYEMQTHVFFMPGSTTSTSTTTVSSTTTTTTTTQLEIDDDSGIPLDDDAGDAAGDAADGEEDDEEGCCGC